MSKIIQIFKCKKQVTGVAPIINTTDDNWELINISSSEGGGSSIEISQDIETDKLSTDKVPSTKAVYDFISWIPKDIITNQEFNTGKTIDGKTIYGIYLNKGEFTTGDKNIIYATSNLIEVNSSLSTLNVFGHIKNSTTPAILELQVPYEYATGITPPSEMSNFYFFIGFIFYTKKDRKIYEGTEYQVINDKTQEPINPKNKVLLYTIDITEPNSGRLTHKMKWTPSNPAMTNDNGSWGDAFFALGGMWNTRKAGEMIITKVDGSQFTMKGWYNNLIDDPYNQPDTTIVNETKQSFFFVNTIKKIKPSPFSLRFEDDTQFNSDYNYVRFNWMPNSANSLLVSPEEWSFSERADTYKIKKVEIYLYEY